MRLFQGNMKQHLMVHKNKKTEDVKEKETEEGCLMQSEREEKAASSPPASQNHPTVNPIPERPPGPHAISSPFFLFLFIRPCTVCQGLSRCLGSPLKCIHRKCSKTLACRIPKAHVPRVPQELQFRFRSSDSYEDSHGRQAIQVPCLWQSLHHQRQPKSSSLASVLSAREKSKCHTT